MIAIDVMGGDHAPNAVLDGALSAAKRGIAVTLFGNESFISEYLNKHAPAEWSSLPIVVVHCSQTIEMHEEPSRSVLQKKDSSLVLGMQAVKSGRADAFVSAGNSGAVLVAATLILGRIKDILRPALGSFLPHYSGNFFCLDLGANTDCKSDFLEQFAIMGHLYVSLVMKINSPRIALLSNGHEQYKGSIAVKEAYKRLEEQSALNFVGNVEARDVFDNKMDVLVCDGFVGNVMLKTAQGTIRTMIQWLKKEANESLYAALIFSPIVFFSWPVLKKLMAKINYKKMSGALLLGVHHPVVVAHGSSDAQAIEQSIIFAHQVVQEKRIEYFNKSVEKFFNNRVNSKFMIKKGSEAVL